MNHWGDSKIACVSGNLTNHKRVFAETNVRGFPSSKLVDARRIRAVITAKSVSKNRIKTLNTAANVIF